MKIRFSCAHVMNHDHWRGGRLMGERAAMAPVVLVVPVVPGGIASIIGALKY